MEENLGTKGIGNEDSRFQVGIVLQIKEGWLEVQVSSRRKPLIMRIFSVERLFCSLQLSNFTYFNSILTKGFMKELFPWPFLDQEKKTLYKNE